MLLAIDIGNTNTVFALITQDGTVMHSWRLKTTRDKTADEYAAFFYGLSSRDHNDKSVAHVIVSSVVPEANFHIRSFCQNYMDLDAYFVTNDNAGVKIDIDRPEDVGADRLVNAAAINAYHKRAAIVLDFGTATTFDVIDENGIYKGGVISPGINLSISALAQAASKLPKVSIRKPSRMTGKSTTEAMQSGIYFGYVGLINGILNGLIKEMDLDDAPLVLATGGLASTFKGDVPLIEQIDNDLTLKGLYTIFTANKK